MGKIHEKKTRIMDSILRNEHGLAVLLVIQGFLALSMRFNKCTCQFICMNFVLFVNHT